MYCRGVLLIVILHHTLDYHFLQGTRCLADFVSVPDGSDDDDESSSLSLVSTMLLKIVTGTYRPSIAMQRDDIMGKSTPTMIKVLA